MSEAFRRRSVQCLGPGGLHRMAYLEWGDADNPRVLVCVHGLTRCARDFEPLAGAMRDRYRVVCPDVAGRGDSDWLRDPMGYVLPTYVNDMVTMIARLDVEQVDWVGTSMGGLIGMSLAALDGSPVSRLVLNDVGPVIAAAALERIGAYVGGAPAFANMEQAEQYVRTVSATFGPHSDAQWRFLTENAVRPASGGGYRIHYDPALATPFKAQAVGESVDLWAVYDAIRCPALLLRGERSDLLARETAEQMGARGPRARLVEFASVGHAPTLLHPEQIGVVRDFLLS